MADNVRMSKRNYQDILDSLRSTFGWSGAMTSGDALDLLNIDVPITFGCNKKWKIHFNSNQYDNERTISISYNDSTLRGVYISEFNKKNSDIQLMYSYYKADDVLHSVIISRIETTDDYDMYFFRDLNDEEKPYLYVKHGNVYETNILLGEVPGCYLIFSDANMPGADANNLDFTLYIVENYDIICREDTPGQVRYSGLLDVDYSASKRILQMGQDRTFLKISDDFCNNFIIFSAIKESLMKVELTYNESEGIYYYVNDNLGMIISFSEVRQLYGETFVPGTYISSPALDQMRNLLVHFNPYNRLSLLSKLIGIVPIYDKPVQYLPDDLSKLDRAMLPEIFRYDFVVDYSNRSRTELTYPIYSWNRFLQRSRTIDDISLWETGIVVKLEGLMSARADISYHDNSIVKNKDLVLWGGGYLDHPLNDISYSLEFSHASFDSDIDGWSPILHIRNDGMLLVDYDRMNTSNINKILVTFTYLDKQNSITDEPLHKINNVVTNSASNNLDIIAIESDSEIGKFKSLFDFPNPDNLFYALYHPFMALVILKHEDPAALVTSMTGTNSDRHLYFNIGTYMIHYQESSEGDVRIEFSDNLLEDEVAAIIIFSTNFQRSSQLETALGTLLILTLPDMYAIQFYTEDESFINQIEVNSYDAVNVSDSDIPIGYDEFEFEGESYSREGLISALNGLGRIGISYSVTCKKKVV